MYNWLDFFKDKQGQIVIAQTPNAPLMGWIVFTILNTVLGSYHHSIHHIFSMLSFGFIFTWAWLEIVSGVNGFRRALGLSVLFVVVCS